MKKTPLSDGEREYFMRWIRSRQTIEDVLQQENTPDMDVTSIFHTRLEYLHSEQVGTDYARYIQSPNTDTFWGSAVRLTPTTDDNPFIFDVDTG